MSEARIPAGSVATAATVPATVRVPSMWADYLALAKPRLNLLVVMTTLVAGGASALNQLWEKDTDKLMQRTRRRPLPDGRMTPALALWFGVALCVVGFADLWVFTNPRAATVALATMLSYLVWYTPLKLRSSLSTIVGAIPGALPALMGWTAATDTLSIPGWVLCGIVFMWQMPHFLAIAWMYRDDYARAGIPLLPVIEPDGRSTGRQAVLYAAVLIPVSFLPTAVGLATVWYLAGAIVLGAILLVLSLEFSATRGMFAAKRLFYATILYLPLLWIALLADHFIHGL